MIHRKDNLRKNYGLTPACYDLMFEAQNGVCAICSQPPPDGKNLHIDHDHSTGKVRSLLCTKCNTAIGLFDDDTSRMMNAIQYLHHHRNKTEAA